MTRRAAIAFRWANGLAVALVWALVADPQIASAQGSLEVLHTFPECNASRSLYSPYIQASDGDLYGTTDVTTGFGGTVFKMTRAGAVTVLHTFVGGAADGGNPRAPLLQASDGNFYGTTFAGGSVNAGTAFRITSSGTFTLLHSFIGGAADGAYPGSAGLIQATDGNFYGVTLGGGVNNGGTMFRMTPSGAVTVVHEFVGGSVDGLSPRSLLRTTGGTFYGVTTQGGSSNTGTVFSMTADGATTVLYSSFPKGDLTGSRIYSPSPGGDLVQAADGNFYGTLLQYSNYLGVRDSIFKVTPGGTYITVAGVESMRNASGLTRASDGNLYGTALQTPFFGDFNPATRHHFFKLSMSGMLTTLLTLPQETGCAGPSSTMLHASDGKFYGTTGGGKVYRLSVSPMVSPSSHQTVTGRPVTFTVSAPGVPGATYQWQVSSDNGSTWTDISNGSAYSGATNATLSVTPATTAFNGYRFRAVATNGNGSETSDAVTLGVRRRATLDHDGDGASDLSIFRPGSGDWFVSKSSTSYGTNTTENLGAPGDLPVAGDYDGDGATDLAVYRPSTGVWYIRVGGTTSAYQYGLGGDLAVPGDYDGDGRHDLAVYRPATGVWFIRVSSGSYTTTTTAGLGVGADIPVPADYDGDGKTDVAVYRPSSGMWVIRYSGSSLTELKQWGLAAFIPVPGDYDGDRKADLAVWYPALGTWYVLQSSTNYSSSITLQWGFSTDTPVPADYDGDGKIDIAVYRPSNGTWFLKTSTSGYAASQSYQWGLAGDIPLPNAPIARAAAASTSAALTSTLANLSRASDLDTDGRSDLTVFRPSTGTWFTLSSNSNNYSVSSTRVLGANGDTPVAADYDGDGTTDAAVYTPSTAVWSVLRSSLGAMSVQWGLVGDEPVAGDYDGDSKSDVAVFRPSTGVWFILQSTTNFATQLQIQWGLPGDVPVPGDYDGDAITDIAVYRPTTGVWYIVTSSSGFATSQSRQFGLSGDITVPGDYDRDGKTDLAVYRPSTGVWYVKHSSNVDPSAFVMQQWGLFDDVPVPGDHDGDGRTDMAVWRPSTGVWYLLNSSSNNSTFRAVQWGLPGDSPILKRR